MKTKRKELRTIILVCLLFLCCGIFSSGVKQANAYTSQKQVKTALKKTKKKMQTAKKEYLKAKKNYNITFLKNGLSANGLFRTGFSRASYVYTQKEKKYKKIKKKYNNLKKALNFKVKSKSIELAVGKSKNLKPSKTYSNKITWKSSRPSVVSVSGGRITGRHFGNATITAKTNLSNKTSHIYVKVSDRRNSEWKENETAYEPTIKFESDSYYFYSEDIGKQKTLTFSSNLPNLTYSSDDAIRIDKVEYSLDKKQADCVQGTIYYTIMKQCSDAEIKITHVIPDDYDEDTIIKGTVSISVYDTTPEHLDLLYLGDDFDYYSYSYREYYYHTLTLPPNVTMQNISGYDESVAACEIIKNRTEEDSTKTFVSFKVIPKGYGDTTATIELSDGYKWTFSIHIPEVGLEDNSGEEIDCEEGAGVHMGLGYREYNVIRLPEDVTIERIHGYNQNILSCEIGYCSSYADSKKGYSQEITLHATGIGKTHLTIELSNGYVLSVPVTIEGTALFDSNDEEVKNIDLSYYGADYDYSSDDDYIFYIKKLPNGFGEDEYPLIGEADIFDIELEEIQDENGQIYYRITIIPNDITNYEDYDDYDECAKGSLSINCGAVGIRIPVKITTIFLRDSRYEKIDKSYPYEITLIDSFDNCSEEDLKFSFHLDGSTYLEGNPAQYTLDCNSCDVEVTEDEEHNITMLLKDLEGDSGYVDVTINLLNFETTYRILFMQPE